MYKHCRSIWNFQKSQSYNSNHRFRKQWTWRSCPLSILIRVLIVYMSVGIQYTWTVLLVLDFSLLSLSSATFSLNILTPNMPESLWLLDIWGSLEKCFSFHCQTRQYILCPLIIFCAQFLIFTLWGCPQFWNN